MTGGIEPASAAGDELARAERAERLVAQGSAGVGPLVSMLTDPSWSIRRRVVEALASLGDAAVQPLCAVLLHQRDNEARLAAAVDALSASSGDAEAALAPLASHPNPNIVADAAQVLGRRRSASAVPTLIQLVSHSNDNVAVAAIEALGRVGGRAAVSSLIAAVESSNFFRVFPAIDVLGRSGDPRAVEPLAGLLAQPTFAMEAARALGRTAARAAVGPLAALLGAHADAMVRVAAVSLCDLFDRFHGRAGTAGDLEPLLRQHASGTAPRRLAQCLPAADVTETVSICRLLGIIGSDEVVPALSARLDGPPVVAQAAAEGLRRVSRHADAQLARALRTGDSDRRKSLLRIVSRHQTAPEVVHCLHDPDPEARGLACEALARMAYPAAVEPLFRALEDDSARVRHAAVASIQALGTAQARELAMDAARSPVAEVRRAALGILAYFGHAPALELFLGALEDPDERVQDAAIQGLPYLEDRQALAALLETAQREAPRARAIAMRTLGHCSGDSRVQARLLEGLSDPHPWVRYYACQSLGRLGYVPAATRIGELVSDEAAQVRIAAVEALAYLSIDEAHEVLRRAATADDPDIRRAALIGLGMRGHEEDLAVILRSLSSTDTATRLVSLSALSGFSAPSVMSALREAAADRDEQVSTSAIGFLSLRPEPKATAILVDLLGSPICRARAAAALEMPAPARVSGLLTALEHASDELAPLLTSALARMHRPDATAGLFHAMHSLNVPARKATASTLAALGTPEAAGVLREASQTDPSPAVRQICALLLAQ